MQRKFNPWIRGKNKKNCPRNNFVDSESKKSTGSIPRITVDQVVPDIEEPHIPCPEHDLMCAIVERAVTDCRLPSTLMEDKRDARSWIFSNSRKPWSFLWVVRELDLDWGFVRSLREYVKTLC